MACASPLGEGTGRPREERKVVSVLFCDLVGSTAAAHSADPEDVRRALTEYHAAVRAEIERFGGIVEKFIGDAAVGVWGVPQAHEDDAERAVRAARAILDGVAVDVRLAVNTGEVLATLDPLIDPGVGIVGDVVNTASRLQNAAPIGGILVGEGTMRATESIVVYEELEAVALKGKPDPVPVWRVVSVDPTAARGRGRAESPFVGRRREVDLLMGVFERSMDSRSLQLVTVIGEPGIGKSRLVAEFERLVEMRESLLRLRGRCLAYGDGIGFWPLAEAVKQYLGLNERDSAEEAEARLEKAVSGMEDAEWLRARLAPLIGLEGEGGDREAAFAAWQRFFDEIASRTPLVLVFEDLHWANPAMLDFVQYLAEWSTDVPLLVVGTARPELFEAHPQWGGGLANATTLALRPLDNADATALAGVLLGRVAASSLQATLVDRCGGNPLFAEEYARLLSERSASALESAEMPETVQALIAARIDTLSPERKDLLHDAAVIGKTFWAGAVAELGGRERGSVQGDLHELARKELLRRSRNSTVPADEEYSFWHDLVHQVTYEQIPRDQRADRHRRAARWIEQTAGERPGDRAELIAHHYLQALSLERDKDSEAAGGLRRSAIRFLTIAGERAVGLDVDHAIELLSRAIDLTKPDAPERGKILVLIGTSEMLAGRFDKAIPVLAEARRAADAIGDLETIAVAYFQEAEALFFGGAGDDYRQALVEAIARLDGERPTGGYALVLSSAAFGKLTQNDNESARALVQRAVSLADEVGDRFAYAAAVDIRGLLHLRLGDQAAISDFESAIEIFTMLGSPYATMAMTHLGSAIHNWYGPAKAERPLQEAGAHGRRIHNATYEVDALVFETDRRYDQGLWDGVLEIADRVEAWAASKSSSSAAWTMIALTKARVLALRGDFEAALAVAEPLAEHAEQLGDEDSVWALTSCAIVRWLDGRETSALELMRRVTPERMTSVSAVAEVTRLLVRLGASGHAHALLATLLTGPPKFFHNRFSAQAALAEASGDRKRAQDLFEAASSGWRQFGNPYELAHSLAGQARTASSLDAKTCSLAAESTTLFNELGVVDRARPSLGSWAADASKSSLMQALKDR